MQTQMQELRAIGLDGIYKTTLRFIVCAMISSLVLWTLAFGLRVYLRYDILARDYQDAVATLHLANHRVSGYRYSQRHPADVAEAHELFKMTRKKRALVEEWNESHLCGSTSCTSLLVGEHTLHSLVLYFVASAFGVSLIANGVINIFWLATRSSLSTHGTAETAHEKTE